MKSRFGTNNGFVKSFLVLLVIIAVAYIGMAFGKPYYRYNTLRSHTKDTLLAGMTDVDAIKKEVLDNAAELHIPLDEGNTEVTKNEMSKVIKVKANWSEVVDFWGYYQKKLDFVMEVEG